MLYCPENDALTRAYEQRFPFFGPESYGFMMENQAHSGAEPIGTFTIFTWGNGSALASAATIRETWGDLWLEPRKRRALPIDGGLSVEVSGETVSVEDRYGRRSIRCVAEKEQPRELELVRGCVSFRAR